MKHYKNFNGTKYKSLVEDFDLSIEEVIKTIQKNNESKKVNEKQIKEKVKNKVKDDNNFTQKFSKEDEDIDVLKFFKMLKNNKDNNFGKKKLIKSNQIRIVSSQKYKNKYINKMLSSNYISNSKYNFVTFIPFVLYNQFKYFFNLYFLFISLSQFVPELKIGNLASYIFPLFFVLILTMTKEAVSDIKRRFRDKIQNNASYETFYMNNKHDYKLKTKFIPSMQLKVGDIIKLNKNERIPADMILLKSSEVEGKEEVFLRTDQLDGETDSKLRSSCIATQFLSISEIFNDMILKISKPTELLNNFHGQLYLISDDGKNYKSYCLTIDQTMWANTVLSSGSAIGIVIYTGYETKQMINSKKTRTKISQLEIELNTVSKILFSILILFSLILLAKKGYLKNKTWYIDLLKFCVILSSMIPVSLKVILSFVKSIYSFQIQNDKSIENTVVRTSTIAEDLGKISYVLADKTGTLTQNEMVLKLIFVNNIKFYTDNLDVIRNKFKNSFDSIYKIKSQNNDTNCYLNSEFYYLILAFALCNYTRPTYDTFHDELNKTPSYESLSPDEIELTKFASQIGLTLVKRNFNIIELFYSKLNIFLCFEILNVFPFNSTLKKMSIILLDKLNNEIIFFIKGADDVIIPLIKTNLFLEKETKLMAQEGLRTLVFAKKKLNNDQYSSYIKEYREALNSISNRIKKLNDVTKKYLEWDLDFLGITGVEDKLQPKIKTTIENLKNAGIKIWMLTGDKMETAKCVAISSKLVNQFSSFFSINNLSNYNLAVQKLDILNSNQNLSLVLDGESLEFYIENMSKRFILTVTKVQSVIICRCTPQQKENVTFLIKKITGKKVCCIGDGGNDVRMIQSASVGIGIIGKEGSNASLAADFSIKHFYYLQTLLLWHGRNFYKRSSNIIHFIIHRGLMISFVQIIHSITLQFNPISLYTGWLLVGYSTIYTIGPVFSLVFDNDISKNLVKMYPELYNELLSSNLLSCKSIFVSILISLYQSVVIQLMSQLIYTTEKNTKKMITISFSCLVYNELIMVLLIANKFHKLIIINILICLIFFWCSIPFLQNVFELKFFLSIDYAINVFKILFISIFPVRVIQFIKKKIKLQDYEKIQQMV